MDNEQAQQIQQDYLEALNSGDHKEQQRLKKEIDSIFDREEKEYKESRNKTTETSTPLDIQDDVVETGEADTSKDKSGEVEEPLKATSSKDGDPSPKEENEQETKEWYEDLPEDQQNAVKQILEDNSKLHHRIKSDDGRVAAYQRGQAEADRRYKELQQETVKLKEILSREPTAQSDNQTAAASAAKGKATQATGPKRRLTVDDVPEFKQLASTDPELAELFLNRENILREEMSSLKDAVYGDLEPLRKTSNESKTNQEVNRLLSIVPNANEIFNYRSPEGVNTWEDWLFRQPKGVQSLATSDYADDVVEALRLYGMAMNRVYSYSSEGASNSDKEHQQNGQVSERAGSTQAERERKLRAVPVGSASNVRPPQKAELSMEEILRDPVKLEALQKKILEDELKKRQ